MPVNSGTAYECRCLSGYLGAQCTIPDPCAITTCYNGGTCTSSLNSAGNQAVASCICPPSQTFVGRLCEHYNPCISAPCVNGATCTYYINVTCFYYCTCPTGFTGERCQFSIAQIRCETVGLPNNCRNGGTCMLMGMNTQCFCGPSFTGALCERNVDACSLRMCQNGGTCIIGVGGVATCQCLSNFQGQYCEFSTDPCSLRPCLNGGQCIASGLTFSCNCAQTMYTGPRCQTLISSPCTSNPVIQFDISLIRLLKYVYTSYFHLVSQWCNLSSCGYFCHLSLCNWFHWYELWTSIKSLCSDSVFKWWFMRQLWSYCIMQLSDEFHGRSLSIY